MLRGYRLHVAALIGIILLTGAQSPAKQANDKKGREQASIAAASQAPTPEPSYRPYADRFSDSCYNAADHDTADLCAQWRAAVAAEKATHEARRATTWAIIAAFLSFATVVGLIVTILQTHGALGEARKGNRISMRASARASRNAVASAADTARAIAIAEKSASAAEKLADQAEITAERQLRAYLSVSGVVFYDSFAGRDDPQLVLEIENHGQTPATLIGRNIGCSWFVSAENSEEFFSHIDAVESDCFPKTSLRIPMLMPREMSNGYEDGLILLIGRIDYRDVFGKTHVLPFQYQTFVKKTYVDVEHGEALVARPFNYSPEKGGKSKA